MEYVSATSPLLVLSTTGWSRAIQGAYLLRVSDLFDVCVLWGKANDILKGFHRPGQWASSNHSTSRRSSVAGHHWHFGREVSGRRHGRSLLTDRDVGEGTGERQRRSELVRYRHCCPHFINASGIRGSLHSLTRCAIFIQFSPPSKDNTEIPDTVQDINPPSTDAAVMANILQDKFKG